MEIVGAIASSSFHHRRLALSLVVRSFGKTGYFPFSSLMNFEIMERYWLPTNCL